MRRDQTQVRVPPQDDSYEEFDSYIDYGRQGFSRDRRVARHDRKFGMHNGINTIEIM